MTEIIEKELVFDAVKKLKEAGIDSAQLDIRILWQHSRQNKDDFIALVERRKNREPISHIIGKREFFSRDFVVTKDVLDPRPDSETLIETVLKIYADKNKKLTIVDFGTGTGCLLLTLLKEFPFSNGIGVDISEPALIVANQNCMNLGLQVRAEFRKSFWGDGLKDKFDLIISNPPYIKNNDIKELEPEVSIHEPAIALSGGDSGLKCYLELMPYIKRLMAPEGTAVIEIGYDQAESVKKIVLDNGLKVNQVVPDLAGNDRCIVIKHNEEI